MARYHTKPLKFVCRGLCLSRPVNLQPPGKYPLLLNVRSLQDGTLETRGGIDAYLTTPLPETNVHSVRGLNDPKPAAVNPLAIVAGAGTKLYANTSGNDPLAFGPFTLNELATGFSGKPLSLVLASPVDSPESWMYVADSQKMLKLRTDGLVHNVGVAPPSKAPSADITDSPTLTISSLDSTTGWAATGTASAIVTAARVPATTTIEAILYDSGATGMASVVVNSVSGDYSWLAPGERLKLGMEYVSVLDVHLDAGATTIQGIVYDSGSTGLCTIQLAIALFSINRDSVLKIDSEYVRVLSSTPSADGSYSLRCSTASTHAAGDAVEAKRSIRTETAATYSAGQDIGGDYLSWTMASGVGNVAFSFTAPPDLSRIGPRTVNANDRIHISLRASAPSVITSIVLKFWTFAGTPPVTAGFYSYTISGAALVVNQWFEISFPLSALVLQDEQGLQGLATLYTLDLQVTATGASTVDASSWALQGGYDAEVGDGDLNGFLYRYRYRSSLTGAKSVQSPETRYQLRPKNQLVTLTATASADTQVDLIDWERFGGSNNSWNYIATGPNSTAAVPDSFSSTAIGSNGPLETDVFQPFPVQGLPVLGACNMIGTSLMRSGGAAFDTRWARGTIIRVGEGTFTLYAPPTDADHLELEQSGPVGIGVAWSVNSPTIQGQPLAKLWGPIGGETAQFWFACGDPLNPGRLYFTKGNNPDAAPDNFFIDVTTPGEPLVNGLVWNNQAFVWSGRRLFAIRPTLGGINPFVVQETFVGHGLAADWAFCVGPYIWFLDRDGLYQTDGHSAVNISDEDLYPLFTHGHRTGVEVTIRGVTYRPPELQEIPKLRLAYHDGYVIFDYEDTGANRHTLSYRLVDKSWWFDGHSPELVMHYSMIEAPGQNWLLSGTVTGQVVKNAGLDDLGTLIPCGFVTPAFDADDSRAQKQFGDTVVAARFIGTTVTVIPVLDSLTSVLLSQALFDSGTNEVQKVIDLQGGGGVLARNLSLDFSWLSDQRVQFYEWIPSWVSKVESSLLRASDWTDAGFPGRKYIRAVVIHADTYGSARTIVIGKDGANGPTISNVVHSGEQSKPYAFTPFVAELVRLQPQDAGSWRLFDDRVSWVYDRYPELTAAVTGISNGGSNGAKWVQGVRLPADTDGKTVVVTVLYDGGLTGAAFTANHVGKQTLPYSWTPFVARNLQLQPAAPISIWENEIEWVVDALPDLAAIWTTEPMTHDTQGWGHVRSGYIALMAPSDVTLTVTTDASPGTFTVTLPATGSTVIFGKPYFSLPANKGRWYQYSFTSPAPFRLFLRDCEVHIRAWGAPGPYQVVRPFGDVSRLTGARL